MISEAARKKEEELSAVRILELRLNPIKGNFDVTHLKEVHRYIFQDLPKAGLTHIPPGEFRSESAQWYKFREPSLLKKGYYVSYSKMDSASRKFLDDTLAQIKPDVFKTFKAEEFPRKLGEAYARLDYIHPFCDGNSRTLRELTHQFSNECGQKVKWELFSLSEAGRSHLYIARDRPVIEFAIHNTTDPNIRAHLIITAERLKNFKPLPELLNECVQAKKPELVLYAGSNQSGKSTLASMNEHSPQKFHQALFGQAIEQKKSLVVEGSLTSDTLKSIQQSKAAGYEINLHFAHTNHAGEGLKRAIEVGKVDINKDAPEFLRDAKENYKNLESGIALSDRAKIYNCSGSAPAMTHDFAEGKLLSGGGYTAPEGIKECSLADNLKDGFIAKLNPDLGLEISGNGIKY